MTGRGDRSDAPGVSPEPFGTLPDGECVERLTLSNRSGMRVAVITYGAGIQAVLVPDGQGRLADVALGHASLGPYVNQPQYIGSTVGRVANRIANGRFRLDGRDHQVPVNDGTNSLHGGATGFDKVNWSVLEAGDDPVPTVVLGHRSADGDQGYPGELIITATYSLNDANELSVEYRAVTDAPTLVNITNHAYWNLGGEGAEEGAMNHLLTIFADRFLPTDGGSIPTGAVLPVDGTPFDFRRPTRIGERVRDAADEQVRIGRGYDHNWVVAHGVAAVPRLVARLEHPRSDRVMELLTNQPGLQFYSGNFLDGTSSGKAGRLYRMGDAVALEPQMFPDAPNQPHFATPRLNPGDTYRNLIIYRFGSEHVAR